MKLFLDGGFAGERIDELTRVLGDGMGRLAATNRRLVRRHLPGGGRERGGGGAALRRAGRSAHPGLRPHPGRGLQGPRARQRPARGAGPGRARRRRHRGAQDLAICFADLVGFTWLGGQVEVGELGTVAGRLASLAASVTEAPVRQVKTIGDAAMFISPEPEALVTVALRLEDAFEQPVRRRAAGTRARLGAGRRTARNRHQGVRRAPQPHRRTRPRRPQTGQEDRGAVRARGRGRPPAGPLRLRRRRPLRRRSRSIRPAPPVS